MRLLLLNRPPIRPESPDGARGQPPRDLHAAVDAASFSTPAHPADTV